MLVGLASMTFIGPLDLSLNLQVELLNLLDLFVGFRTHLFLKWKGGEINGANGVMTIDNLERSLLRGAIR